MSKCQISPIFIILDDIPIKQYFWYDFFESIEDLHYNINRDIFGSRYDDLISKYDQEISKK